MSKLPLSVIIGFALFLSGCGGSFAIIDDTVPTSPKFKKAKMQAGLLQEAQFDDFKLKGKRSIQDDETLSLASKRKKVEALEALAYMPNQSLYFTMVNSTPFSNDELALKFRVVAKRKNLYSGFSLIPIRQYETTQYGTTVSYNYTFLIHLTKPLASPTTPETASPRLLIRFPDKCERIYEVKI